MFVIPLQRKSVEQSKNFLLHKLFRSKKFDSVFREGSHNKHFIVDPSSPRYRLQDPRLLRHARRAPSCGQEGLEALPQPRHDVSLGNLGADVGHGIGGGGGDVGELGEDVTHGFDEVDIVGVGGGADVSGESFAKIDDGDDEVVGEVLVAAEDGGTEGDEERD